MNLLASITAKVADLNQVDLTEFERNEKALNIECVKRFFFFYHKNI